jgi:hypothetical protein
VFYIKKLPHPEEARRAVSKDEEPRSGVSKHDGWVKVIGTWHNI